MVLMHAACGTTQDHVARLLGIGRETLEKYYRDELDLGLSKANSQIAGKLFAKALEGDTASMIFWLKTRARWRETNRHEHTGPDGGPVKAEMKIDLSDLMSDLADDERANLRAILERRAVQSEGGASGA